MRRRMFVNRNRKNRNPIIEGGHVTLNNADISLY